MKRLLAALTAAFFISGCALLIDANNPPPEDWPELEILIVTESFLKVQQRCGGSLLVQYSACAGPDFDKKVCWIFTATDDEHVIEHERWHCIGYDHVGSTALRDYWERWKKERK